MIYKRKKILIALFLITLTFLCGACRDNDNAGGETRVGAPVNITSPLIMNMTDYLQLNGSTVFLNKEIVRTTFQGFIEKAFKNIGDEVMPGDILFRIKTKEAAAADTVKFNVNGEAFKGDVFIKSKSKGILTELDFHAGDFVSDGEQIAVISNPSTMVVKLSVPYESVSKLKLKQKCLVVLPGGEKFTGLIDKRVPSVDPGTQAQVYIIKLAVDKEIPENLNVMVKIPVNNFSNAIALPKSAILSNVTENSFWVMKLLNDSLAVKVDIKKGIESDSLIQVLFPAFDKNDRIISNGAYGLPDTARIEIVK